MIESGTISKEEAGYVDEAVGPRRCADCSMFRHMNHCTLVCGDISASGWCRHFTWIRLSADFVRSLFVTTAVIVALVLVSANKTVFGQVVEQRITSSEQRLGITIGALYVENARLAVELDKAKQTIGQLQAELQRLKEEKK